MYIKALYKEKREGESRTDQINRRLSFKLPIALRYSAVGALFVASIHSFMARKLYFGRYFVLGTPLLMLGICWEEVMELRRIRK